MKRLFFVSEKGMPKSTATVAGREELSGMWAGRAHAGFAKVKSMASREPEHAGLQHERSLVSSFISVHFDAGKTSCWCWNRFLLVTLQNRQPRARTRSSIGPRRARRFNQSCCLEAGSPRQYFSILRDRERHLTFVRDLSVARPRKTLRCPELQVVLL